jgi:hypothetical protein
VARRAPRFVTLRGMTSRSLLLAAACTIALFTAAAPAMATPSVAIDAPATTTADTAVDVTYSGRVEPVTDVPTTLRLFYQKDAPNCAAVAADQRNRANSTFDGVQVFTEPGPFTLTSNLTFAEGGSYRFCAYLESGATSDTQPPIAFAERVLLVSGPKIPCNVPNLRGLTLEKAKAKLLSTGCKLGKVIKPKKAGKKKLVVADTSPPARVKGLPYGTKINLTMKVVKKKR